MRIGHGYDVHQLVAGRDLILGGVHVPYEKGLLGHSDADVVTHAVMDALLGAMALGSIGDHFPDTAEEYRGANSMMLLTKVVDMMKQGGFSLGNLDVTVVAQAPKLAPHIFAMKENLAKVLLVPLSDINIKATTEEHLGFTGAGLGIACHAVCILQKSSPQHKNVAI